MMVTMKNADDAKDVFLRTNSFHVENDEDDGNEEYLSFGFLINRTHL